MALTINHSRGARTRTAAVDATAPRVYERPTGAALTGLAAVVVGAWGALAGYIGPYFAFRPVATRVWVGNWQNGLLHLLPGAVAAAAGLMLLAMGPARRSVRGGALVLPATLLLAAGAWFVIGPVAWPTFHSGTPFNPVMSPTRNLLDVACASYGPGLVLAMLGGMALKAGSVRAIPVEDPYTPAEAAAPAGPAVAEREGMAERERLAERDRLAERERLAAAERDRPAGQDRMAGREGVGPMAEAEATGPGAGGGTQRTADPTMTDTPATSADPTVVEQPSTGSSRFWRRSR
ncbi:MAG TPA: hypothetical protein VFH70_12435 [Acidimicrobiales bacterium]|nr:hypothetical protein [Acidimicrobiales bacterium]